MPPEKLTVQQFAAKVKAKYPDYQSMDDSTLAAKMIAKYPEYKEQVSFDGSSNEPQKKNLSPTGGDVSNVGSQPSQDGSVSMIAPPTQPVAPQLANVDKLATLAPDLHKSVLDAQSLAGQDAIGKAGIQEGVQNAIKDVDNFAGNLVGKHTDLGYVDANNQPINKFKIGNIVAVPKDKKLDDGNMYPSGFMQLVQGADGQQRWRMTTPPNPAFVEPQQEQGGVAITAFKGVPNNDKIKIDDVYKELGENRWGEKVEGGDAYWQDKPALRNYAKMAASDNGAKQIPFFLKQHPEISAVLENEMAATPRQAESQEGQYSLLTKAVIKKYSLDKSPYYVDGVEQMTDEPAFRKALEDLNKDPNDKSAMAVLQEPNNQRILDRMKRQYEGQRILDGVPKLFPKMGEEEQKQFDENLSTNDSFYQKYLANPAKNLYNGALGTLLKTGKAVGDLIGNEGGSTQNRESQFNNVLDNALAKTKQYAETDPYTGETNWGNTIANFEAEGANMVGSIAPTMIGGGAGKIGQALSAVFMAAPAYEDNLKEYRAAGVPEERAQLMAGINSALMGALGAGLGSSKIAEGFKISNTAMQLALNPETKEAGVKQIISDFMDYASTKGKDVLKGTTKATLEMQGIGVVNAAMNTMANNAYKTNLNEDLPDMKSMARTWLSFGLQQGAMAGLSLAREKSAISKESFQQHAIYTAAKENPQVAITQIDGALAALGADSPLRAELEANRAKVEQFANQKFPKSMDAAQKTIALGLNEEIKAKQAEIDGVDEAYQAPAKAELKELQTKLDNVVANPIVARAELSKGQSKVKEVLSPQENVEKPQEPTVEATEKPQESAIVATDPFGSKPEHTETPEHITHDGKYKLTTENGITKAINIDTGAEVGKDTKRKIIAEAADKFDFTQGERATFPEDFKGDEKAADMHTIEHSTSPIEIAETYVRQTPITEGLSSREAAIDEYGVGKVNEKSFGSFDDTNNKTNGIAKTYLSKDGASLDSIAKEISDHSGIDVSPQDVADYMKRFPQGNPERKTLQNHPVAEAAKEKFLQLTGLPLDNKTAEKAINQVWDKDYKEYHKFAEEHFENQQQLEDAYYSQFPQAERPTTESNEPIAKESGNNEAGKAIEKPIEPKASRPSSAEKPSPSQEAVKAEPSSTSIKNEVVERESGTHIEREMKRSYGQVLDEAKKIIADNPSHAAELTKSLLTKSRPLTDTEDATLLLDRNRIRMERKSVMEQMEAAESKDEKIILAARLNTLDDQMRDNDLAVTHAGTQNARGLAARRMMLKEDYSLDVIERKARAANLGEDISEHQRAQFEELSKKYEEATKKLDEYEKEKTERDQKATEQEAVDNIKAEAKRAKTASVKKSVADKALSKLDAWEKKLKSAGYADATGVVSLLQTGITAAKLAIKLGDSIHKALKAARAEIEKQFGKDWDKTEWEKVEQDLFGVDPTQIEMVDGKLKIPKQLLRDLVENGVENIKELTEKVKAIAIVDHPEITDKIVRDSITDYGKTVNPNQQEIETKLREMKAQGKLISSLELAEQGQSPLKSGFQHEKPSDEVRRLKVAVKDAMKEHGVESDNRTPEQKWASALDAVKTRLTNRIADLNDQIKRGIKDRPKKSVEYDDKAKELKAEADELKKTLDEMVGKPEMTDEDRIKLATKSLERSIAKVDDDIARARAGDYSKETRSVAPQSDIIDQLKADKKAKQQLLKDITPENVIEQQAQEQALKSLKTRVANNIADLQEKLDTKNFEVKKKRVIVLDKEAEDLKLKQAEIKKKVDVELAKIKYANQPKLDARLTTLKRIRRAGVLSGLTVLGKLGNSALQIMASVPTEQLIGTLYHYAAKGTTALTGGKVNFAALSEKAPVEGGTMTTAAGKAFFGELFNKDVYKDSWKIIKGQGGKLDLLHGKDHAEPFKWYDTFGNIHAAIKNPIKRAVYERSIMKRTIHLLKTQSTPVTEAQDALIRTNAYVDARRAIFMGENKATLFYKRGIMGLEQSGDAGKKWAAAAKFLFPIVEVPTNFALSVASYAGGALKAGVMISKGVEKLTPEQADTAMRNFKKNGLGGLLITLGYFAGGAIGGNNSKNGLLNVGGYYDGKRNEDDLEAKGIEVFGVDLPHWMSHSPLMECLQIGATLRRVNDKEQEKDGDNAIIKSIWSASLGVGQEIPFINTLSMLARSFHKDNTGANLAGEQLRSFFEPQLLQEAADATDRIMNGYDTKRKPNGFWDQILMGIPGARQTLEKKE